MQYRELGTTGAMLSCIGFGGIVVSGMEQSQANTTVSRAVDRGINYFDVAPSYGDAEERLGPALRPYRHGAFLACKTQQRSRLEARGELEQSLKRLQTDHFDLYQLHAMTTQADFEQATAPGGALEALEEARQEGLIRFLGFSAHSAEIALKLLEAFRFDSVLFPVNWVNYFQAGFGPQVVEAARSRQVGRLALKAMARSRWQSEGDRRQKAPNCWYEPVQDPAEQALALRFTLSEPITAAIPPGDPALFWRAVEIAEHFEPLSPGEREELRRRAAAVQPLFPLVQA
jgi:aryl-alcohol dehydrogenase-like predicted oxidoreductase